MNATIWDNLGHAYYNTKNFEKAFACYKHAIILSPNPSFAFLNLGLFFMKNKHEAAVCRTTSAIARQRILRRSTRGAALIVAIYSIRALECAIEMGSRNRSFRERLGISTVLASPY